MYIPPTKLVFFSFKSPTKPVYLKKHLPLSLQIPPKKQHTPIFQSNKTSISI